ncbi:MAG TPA: hypothetical protein EYP58_06045 [bacterium (Candidatus Stahlbacteria)]|nr:hypothetical protein [Candidatus Stahlbacteria bacterium]
MVDVIADANIDHIFLQVYANGETIYPSDILRTNLRFSRGQDPLSRVIRRADSYGIKVHAWFNVFYIWGYSPTPADPTHPLKGNWAVCDRQGRSIKDYTPVQLKNLGIEGYYVSPFNPSYQNLILSLIDEVITKYDVDGIHLDYIRFPSLTFGYDPWARTVFARRYYLDPLTSQNLNEIIDQENQYQIHMRYREVLSDGLTEFIRRITESVHKRKPIKVSAAVKPDPHEARTRYGQDWLKWLTTGSIDFVITMSYTSNTNWILKTIGRLKPRDRIWIGIGTYLQDRRSITNQISTLRRHGYEDLVIFSFEDLRKRRWLPSCWQ